MTSFTYDSNGVPVSVQVGSDPATAPRYYYVYNGHGDVVALTDTLGNSVATYAYDTFGVPTTNTESFPGGWSNPYRYDGRDRVRYDNEGCIWTWQNQSGTPATTTDDAFLYDGAGQQVARHVSMHARLTTTMCVDELDEVTGSTLIENFTAPGLPTRSTVGSTLSYLTSDGLTSVSEAPDCSSTVTFQQLHAPYSGARYSNGISTTSACLHWAAYRHEAAAHSSAATLKTRGKLDRSGYPYLCHSLFTNASSAYMIASMPRTPS